MASQSSSKASREPSALSKAYLFLYNFMQVIGWSYLLYLLIKYYATPKNELSLWEVVKLTLLIAQNGAILEILHAAIRIVPSNPVLTTFQIFSRVLVVNGAMLATPTGAASSGVQLSLFAWSVTEVIRYLYYALNIYGYAPHLLTWLRYTTFIVLYPIGVTGELLCIYAAQSYVASENLWSIQMPNLLNFTFSYSYFLIIIMVGYIPVFLQLYFHMFAQRRKVLGKGPTHQKSK